MPVLLEVGESLRGHYSRWVEKTEVGRLRFENLKRYQEELKEKEAQSRESRAMEAEEKLMKQQLQKERAAELQEIRAMEAEEALMNQRMEKLKAVALGGDFVTKEEDINAASLDNAVDDVLNSF